MNLRKREGKIENILHFRNLMLPKLGIALIATFGSRTRSHFTRKSSFISDWLLLHFRIAERQIIFFAFSNKA
ncbi:hypothetical protein LEP1GSC058_1603 [Leptospira fainei serovar Hurstbridge str. BUT 6]|uniref:Uncharacterized protein n=1 Tax=Leptospira fainei serovar Hurstbridge str. BUT 6 TaxID=1193011 RepID=S3W3Q8_9LEPT|nr:hypothetical protein LEP1GSC058_1603 [Leptospira fainei serovar Hurstbridge str. BUT 6]